MNRLLYAGLLFTAFDLKAGNAGTFSLATDGKSDKSIEIIGILCQGQTPGDLSL
jgi:hypothetical protein